MHLRTASSRFTTRTTQATRLVIRRALATRRRRWRSSDTANGSAQAAASGYLFGTRYLTNGKLDPRELYKHLDNDLAVFKHKSGLRHPQVCFPETNAHPALYQEGWFTELAAWATEHNCHRIQSFWDGQQGDGGKWPPGKAVIRRLRYLSALYAK